MTFSHFLLHFQCIDHCKAAFCGKCSAKHRTSVTTQMSDSTQQLQLCKIDPVTTHDKIDANFTTASQQAIKRTQDTVKNLIAEIHERENLIIKEIENGLEIKRKENWNKGMKSNN